MTYGIKGQQAPDIRVDKRIGPDGKETSRPAFLDGFEKGKATILYCFQGRCPGCHSGGFPTLKHIYENIKGYDIANFAVIQTVFEGFDANDISKITEAQEKYELPLYFGHDDGFQTGASRSQTMIDYRTGGTPWFIYIDSDGVVQINDFRPNATEVAAFLEHELVKQDKKPKES